MGWFDRSTIVVGLASVAEAVEAVGTVAGILPHSSQTWALAPAPPIQTFGPTSI